jgi:hypothetical protein
VTIHLRAGHEAGQKAHRPSTWPFKPLLSLMLRVRRAGVTEALAALQKARLITRAPRTNQGS